MTLRSVVKVLRWVGAPHWAAVAVALGLAAGPVAAQTSGSIRGHVTSATGLPLASGTVKLTIDRAAEASQRTYSFSFALNGNGDYSGATVVPAIYLAVVFSADGKAVDSLDGVHVEAGKIATVDFDMTRQAYIDAMSAEERKALEESKEKNKAAIEAYQHIRQADGLLLQARDKEKQGQFDQAVTLMQSAIQLAGDQPLLWYTLGETQLGVANAAAAELKGRKISSMPGVVKQYNDALASYRKALDLNLARATPSAVLSGGAWNQVGEILGRLGKSKDAVDAYKKAIAAHPAGTGFYALNEAVTAYAAKEMKDTAAAAGLAIKADPTAAEAYYLRGKATEELLNAALAGGPATVTSNPDPRFTTASAADTYDSLSVDEVGMRTEIISDFEKYYRLAPKGPHAEEVLLVLKENVATPGAVGGVVGGIGALVTWNNASTQGASASVSSKAGTASQPAASAPAASAAPAPVAQPAAVAPAPVVPPAPLAQSAAVAPAAQAVAAAARVIQPANAVVPLAAAGPPVRPAVPIPHNYALIFATDSYAHWPALQNPVADADALNDALTTLYGFQVEEVKNPTGDQIVAKLREYLHRHFEVEDQLMIVFSGHGYFDADLGQGFLAPADALQVEDDLSRRTLLAHATVMSYVNRIPSTHVLLVIDACFAGTLDRKIADSGLRGDPSDVYVHAALPELLERKETKRTRRYFASGGRDFVPDGLAGHHSPFMSAFLVALNRAADQKGYATLEDLQMGLSTVKPEPVWGPIQDEDEPGADFLLLTPAAARLLTAAK
jgi:tetratricopeptide (TPR) repeat protein